MAKLEVSRLISAPTGTVFEYSDTHANYHKLFPNATDMEWSTPRHEVDTKLRMKVKSAGMSMAMKFLTKEVVPDAKIAGVYAEGVTGTWELTFEPVGEATRVVWKTSYELPLGVLGQIADKALVERDMRATAEKVLEAIAEGTEARR